MKQKFFICVFVIWMCNILVEKWLNNNNNHNNTYDVVYQSPFTKLVLYCQMKKNIETNILF